MSERRRAVVTGAASGLGRACARALRARGYVIAALDVRGVPAAEADYVAACDVADVEAVSGAVREVVEALGGVEAAVHCAGAFPEQSVPLHALAPEVWERSIAVNLTGAFSVARAVLPALMETRGALVLIASAAAEQPQAGAAAYATAKAGVAALARAAAIEYAHLGVRVNAVSPGWMDTPMAAPVLQRAALRERVERSVPLGRVAAAEEVAETVVWLLSVGAAYMTGENVVVDGALSRAAFARRDDVTAAWKRIDR